jgi:hypothetical protein
LYIGHVAHFYGSGDPFLKDLADTRAEAPSLGPRH